LIHLPSKRSLEENGDGTMACYDDLGSAKRVQCLALSLDISWDSQYVFESGQFFRTDYHIPWGLCNEIEDPQALDSEKISPVQSSPVQSTNRMAVWSKSSTDSDHLPIASRAVSLRIGTTQQFSLA
jgi:hypothetical protein